jgi:hypothetical protein
MMKHLIPVGVVCLVGCATLGPAFVEEPAPNSREALIYVYRINDEFGSLVPTQIIVNGVEISKLPNNAYTFARVPAGIVTLFATRFEDFNYSEKRRVVLEDNVTGGETYFLKVWTKQASAFSIVTTVKVEYPDQGRKDLQHLRLSKPKQ